jgi:hypothetical protein
VKNKFYIILILLLSLYGGNIYSQELNCNVSINTSSIQGTNKSVFNTLQDAIADFMNNTVWTNTVIDVSERIECNILINITDQPTTVSYKGTIQVQARRPVYGSAYNTVLFNFVDNDFQFKYTEFDPLEFSESAHLSNLTSMLAFYADVIIGLDFDSFSLKGGEPYFLKADKIINNASSSSDPGWKAFDDKGRKNRYWLVNNILDRQYEPLRIFNYNYHRLGLDVMAQSLEKGRMVIKDAVVELERFYDSKPDPFMYYFQIVLDSKADEIVQIFSQAQPEDKKKIFNIMVKVDPASPSKYAALKQ